MSEAVEYVKQAASNLREFAQKYHDSGRVERGQELFADAKNLDAVVDRIVHLEGLTSALPPELGNVHDLPEELLGELSIAKTDELEDQIVTVINAYGGAASLDQILVGLFRKFETIQKRRFIQNKLYRMDMVWGVDGKKGVYTTEKPTLEKLADVVTTFGGRKSAIEDQEDDSEIPF